MPENSGNITCDYMYLRAIIFLHEEVENLHSQYNDIRKIEWNSSYVHQKILSDIEKIKDLFAVTNKRLNFI